MTCVPCCGALGDSRASLVQASQQNPETPADLGHRPTSSARQCCSQGSDRASRLEPSLAKNCSECLRLLPAVTPHGFRHERRSARCGPRHPADSRWSPGQSCRVTRSRAPAGLQQGTTPPAAKGLSSRCLPASEAQVAASPARCQVSAGQDDVRPPGIPGAEHSARPGHSPCVLNACPVNETLSRPGRLLHSGYASRAFKNSFAGCGF